MDRVTSRQTSPRKQVAGFTLTEMAMVLAIVAVLIGGMIIPLSAQRESRLLSDTDSTLAVAKDAVLGFASTNERLPCPATATSSGRETFCSTQTYPCTGTETYEYASNGYCFTYYGGFLPAVTLGMQPIDAGGYAVDGWGNADLSRIRYAVSTNALRSHLTYPPTPYVLTRYQGLKNAILKPDISVCNAGAQVLYSGTAASGDNNYAKCNAGTALTEDAAVLIYSLGKNAPTGGTSADESPNVTVDSAFVSITPGTNFDDQLVWISPGVLYNRMQPACR
jgi:prepilin-type N-terminal cleavage/methylation domain-containing protein